MCLLKLNETVHINRGDGPEKHHVAARGLLSLTVSAIRDIPRPTEAQVICRLDNLLPAITHNTNTISGVIIDSTDPNLTETGQIITICLDNNSREPASALITVAEAIDY
ncbi:MAG: hypothetical protein ABI220_01005 [Candidatus Saccharimonadales bacterium]